jgi:hypothetical protein
MAFIRDGQHLVDVRDTGCKERPCYQLGFDKGTFSQGRGYTSYHKQPRPVCFTRHLHGCPSNSVCPECRTLEVDPPGSLCRQPGCDGMTEEILVPE